MGCQPNTIEDGPSFTKGRSPVNSKTSLMEESVSAKDRPGFSE